MYLNLFANEEAEDCNLGMVKLITKYSSKHLLLGSICNFNSIYV